MPAEIDTTTGQAAFAYAGQPGWHGLGEDVSDAQSIDEMKVKAHLNWRVIKTPVLFETPGLLDPTKKRILRDSFHHVMYRDDTGSVLDVCGPDYTPFQNDEILEFFREYLAEGSMSLETAGSLKGGRIIWVLGKMNAGFTIMGKDYVEGYVLLMNPHQYGKGGVAKATFVRVVCWNTIQAALRDGIEGLKLWHTSEFNEARRQEAKKSLGIARERLDAFEQDANIMAQFHPSKEDAVKLIAKIFKADEKAPLSDQTKTVQHLITLWDGQGVGAMLASAEGTGWGLLNAVTQYIDHEYGRSQDSRIVNAWLGRGEQQKRAAHREILAAAKAA